MTDITDLIIKDFEGFIDEPNEYNFFIGLADYVRYIKQTSEAKPVIEELEKEWRRQYDKLDELEAQSLSELQKPIDEVLALKNHFKELDLEPLNKAVQELEDTANHTKEVLMPTLPEALAACLFGVIVKYKTSTGNEPPFLRSYKNKGSKFNEFDGYKFSSTLDGFNHQQEALNENTQIWLCWHQLAVAQSAIHQEYRDEVVAAVKNQSQILPTHQAQSLSDFQLILNDWVAIQDPVSGSRIAPTGDLAFLDRKGLTLDNFRLFAKRFNSYLLHRITEFLPAKNSAGNKEDRLDFDHSESLLYFQGKEILIAKSKNTSPHCLLKTLFKDPNKLWNYEEVSEDWGDEYDKEKWKRFYNAARKVNQKVAEKTTIGDFLETSKMAVNINKKYLLSN